MTSEQAIALAEILPEINELAHINLLENPELVRLADARTEETQEEACALYASLLAAARVSTTLVKIDIDTPSAESPEVVKALANQVLAYCLRNMRITPDSRKSVDGTQETEQMKYPDVLRHLVGYEEDTAIVDYSYDSDVAPDEDYVIGGTGLVKALTCCLNNLDGNLRNEDSELMRELETGTTAPVAKVPAGKAKNMSKHLLASARKIRVRLQPALDLAKASSSLDRNNYRKLCIIMMAVVSFTNSFLDRLLFLDQTLEEIISRFEDEFPETRQENGHGTVPGRSPLPPPQRQQSFSSAEAEEDLEISETEVRSRSRSNSIMSHTSKQLAEEEARALRVGHSFRRGFLPNHFQLLTNPESMTSEPSDPVHKQHIDQLFEDLGPEADEMRKRVEEKGAFATLHENKADLLKILRDKDPAGWDLFIEAQEKARANVRVGTKDEAPKPCLPDESAIVD
jgi:hypothetical protein